MPYLQEELIGIENLLKLKILALIKITLIQRICLGWRNTLSNLTKNNILAWQKLDISKPPTFKD